MHFVIVGALPQSLTNFRGELISYICSLGHRVTAISAPASEEEIAAIGALGAQFHPIPLERNSLNPRSDLNSLMALRRAYRTLAPDVVLAYTIKPVIWSGLALRSSRSQARFFALVTGLGYAFEGEGMKRRGLRAIVTALYRQALKRADAVIFQNADNRDVFVSRRIVSLQKCRIVNGSGVDTERFAVAPMPQDGTHFLLIARLLGEKGVREYAAAARDVRARHPSATFHLVAPPDSSPDGIPLTEVRGWHDGGVLVYHGAATDVRPFIAGCNVNVLPSYHEGMPRSVLEAMAMGRPILTTDVPGCRETVVPGRNGWLVPRGDARSLAERMEWFITHREQWSAMGSASRDIAVQRFDVHAIVAEMMRIMSIEDAKSSN